MCNVYLCHPPMSPNLTRSWELHTELSHSPYALIQGIPAFRDFTIRCPLYFVILFQWKLAKKVDFRKFFGPNLGFSAKKGFKIRDPRILWYPFANKNHEMWGPPVCNKFQDVSNSLICTKNENWKVSTFLTDLLCYTFDLYLQKVFV